MSLEVIIGVSIVVTIVLMVGVKLALQKVVMFKMDESTIVNFLKEDAAETAQTTERIAAATNLDAARVTQVCGKSPLIAADSGSQGEWCLVTG